MRKIQLLNKSGATTEDPVEVHILNALEKARKRNKKLTRYLAKPETKVNMKGIEDWKSHDFYNYFCSIFREYYKKEYRVSGSLVHAYHRIEAFLRKNNLTNAEYKKFLDVAFSRYFNISKPPTIGAVVSPELVKLLLGKGAMELSTMQDLLTVDARIEKESDEVEKYLLDNGLTKTGEVLKDHLEASGIATELKEDPTLQYLREHGMTQTGYAKES